MTNETIKRYIISSALTFVSAFALAILPMVQGDMEWTKAALFGVLMAGARAGFKAVFEALEGRM